MCYILQILAAALEREIENKDVQQFSQELSSELNMLPPLMVLDSSVGTCSDSESFQLAVLIIRVSV